MGARTFKIFNEQNYTTASAAPSPTPVISMREVDIERRHAHGPVIKERVIDGIRNASIAVILLSDIGEGPA